MLLGVWFAKHSSSQGVQISGISSGNIVLSQQTAEGWMNAALLQSTPERAQTSPAEVCPGGKNPEGTPGPTCQQERIQIQRKELRNLIPQFWALAQLQQDGKKLDPRMVDAAETALISSLKENTGSSNLDEVLRRTGLSMSDIKQRARAQAAFSQMLPPLPAPPSRAQLRRAYQKLKKELATPPQGSAVVWKYYQRSQAQAAERVLRSGGQPSGEPSLDVDGISYNDAVSMPPPWGEFIMRPAGVFLAKCGKGWCAGKVAKPVPAKPAPSLVRIAPLLSNNMIQQERLQQERDLRAKLSKRWASKSSCQGLPACY